MHEQCINQSFNSNDPVNLVHSPPGESKPNWKAEVLKPSVKHLNISTTNETAAAPSGRLMNSPLPRERQSCRGFQPLRCQSRSPCPSCGSSSPSPSSRKRIHCRCSLFMTPPTGLIAGRMHSGQLYRRRWRQETLPGGFLRMNVQSLCLVSSMPRYPQALQELPMVCFLGLTCWRNDKTQNVKERTVQHFETLPSSRYYEIVTRSVSGLSHSGHSTNFLMNPSSMSCNLFASWDPLTM